MKAEWTNKDSLTQGETTGETTEAILVINLMPKSCDECKFETEALNCGKPMCVATPNRRERIEDDSTRPSWCPLRPLPQKKTVKNPIWADRSYDDFDKGYNACLDAITGETE